MTKRIFSMLLALALFICLLPVPLAQAKEDAEFSGERTLEYTMEISDLNNFFNGGRPALEFALRRYAPSWLHYEIQTADRTLTLTMTIPFTSFADYRDKMLTLLTYAPGIYYTPGTAPVLAEDFLPTELLYLLHADSNAPQSLGQWIRISKNTLTLGDETHSFGNEKLRIRFDTEQILPLASIDIDTCHLEDGSLKRTMKLRVDYTHAQDARWEEMIARCKSTGIVEEESYYLRHSVTVELYAGDYQSLAEKTAYCLNTSVQVHQRMVSGQKLSIIWTESYFLDGLLETYGNFYFNYTLPDTMQDVQALSPDTTLSNGVLSARNQPYIQMQYHSDCVISSMEIVTDCSNPFQRIQRTITFTAPTELAVSFHEQVKTYLTERMIQGSGLEIYDQDGIRYYVLRFSSYFWKEIESFTAPFTQSEINCSDSWVPLGESSFSECFGTLLPGLTPPQSTHLRYEFPGQVLTVNGSKAEGSSVVTGVQPELTVTYQQLNPVKTGLEVLGIALLVTLIALRARSVRKQQASQTSSNP